MAISLFLLGNTLSLPIQGETTVGAIRTVFIMGDSEFMLKAILTF